MEFIAATGNAGKLRELRRILEKAGHTVISQKEAGFDIEVDETGITFEENALLKARAICNLSKKPTIADDSGLVAEALNGEPGVYSARYCGFHGNDEANNDKLLQSMQNIPRDKRGAKFVSVIAVCKPDGSHMLAYGECKGWVGFERKGTNGFGYDPIFNIEEYDNRSYAELTDDEKDKISHRGKAMLAMEKSLEGFLKSENKCAMSTAVIGGFKNRQE